MPGKAQYPEFEIVVAGSGKKARLSTKMKLVAIPVLLVHAGTRGEAGDQQTDLDRVPAEAIIQRVEKVDLLVVGTPVYRASYTGALKHLFDLVDYRALTGKTVLLAATGGSPYHGLVFEHQLRPLFGFFGAVTVPTGVYGSPDDFVGAELVGPSIRDRISRAASEAVSLLNSNHADAAVAARIG